MPPHQPAFERSRAQIEIVCRLKQKSIAFRSRRRTPKPLMRLIISRQPKRHGGRAVFVRAWCLWAPFLFHFVSSRSHCNNCSAKYRAHSSASGALFLVRHDVTQDVNGGTRAYAFCYFLCSLSLFQSTHSPCSVFFSLVSSKNRQQTTHTQSL